MTSKDCIPSSRETKLAMAKTRATIPVPQKISSWNISQSAVNAPVAFVKKLGGMLAIPTSSQIPSDYRYGKILSIFMVFNHNDMVKKIAQHKIKHLFCFFYNSNIKIL